MKMTRTFEQFELLQDTFEQWEKNLDEEENEKSTHTHLNNGGEERDTTNARLYTIEVVEPVFSPSLNKRYANELKLWKRLCCEWHQKDFEVMYDSSLNTRIRLTLPPFHHSGNTPSSPITLDPDLKELTWLDDCNTEVSDESTPQPELWGHSDPPVLCWREMGIGCHLIYYVSRTCCTDWV